MSRRGENIYKRKDGRWEARIIIAGSSPGSKTRKSFYDATYKGAKDKMQRYLVDGGNDKQCLYKAILQKWLNSKKHGIKESTYSKYSYMIDKYISPILGDYDISIISTQILENYVSRLLGDDASDTVGLSGKSVRDILTIIKMSMHYSEYLGYKVICDCSLITVKNNQSSMRVLTVEEQSILTKSLLQETDLCKLGILVSLYTGIRVGELCALRWENIDLKAQRISIVQTMQRISDLDSGVKNKTKIIFSEPKSKCSIREVPIPDFLVSILAPFETEPTAFFLSGTDKHYIEPRTMQYCFGRCISKCNIAPANYHALRHTFATRCIEVGFEIKSLSEILGHASVNITLNRYVHSSFNLKLTNMNKLGMLQT